VTWQCLDLFRGVSSLVTGVRLDLFRGVPSLVTGVRLDLFRGVSSFVTGVRLAIFLAIFPLQFRFSSLLTLCKYSDSIFGFFITDSICPLIIFRQPLTDTRLYSFQLSKYVVSILDMRYVGHLDVLSTGNVAMHPCLAS